MTTIQKSSKTEGWVLLLNTRKIHYIRGGKSLCKKWMYFGSKLEAMITGVTLGKEQCGTCLRKLNGA